MLISIFGLRISGVYANRYLVLVLVFICKSIFRAGLTHMDISSWCWCCCRICISILVVGVSVGYGFQYWFWC